MHFYLFSTHLECIFVFSPPVLSVIFFVDGDDPDFCQTFADLASVVSNLPFEGKNVLKIWFSNTPIEILRKRVVALHNFLTVRLVLCSIRVCLNPFNPLRVCFYIFLIRFASKNNEAQNSGDYTVTKP